MIYFKSYSFLPTDSPEDPKVYKLATAKGGAKHAPPMMISLGKDAIMHTVYMAKKQFAF